jgi:hypothetical protein
MLIHDINHPVAKPPEEEKGTYQEKRDEHIRSIRQHKHAFLVICHIHLPSLYFSQINH